MIETVRPAPHYQPGDRRPHPPVGTLHEQLTYARHGRPPEPIPHALRDRIAASIAADPVYWGRVLHHALAAYADAREAD
jgi:hypothetical protein